MEEEKIKKPNYYRIVNWWIQISIGIMLILAVHLRSDWAIVFFFFFMAVTWIFKEVAEVKGWKEVT